MEVIITGALGASGTSTNANAAESESCENPNAFDARYLNLYIKPGARLF
jgi:hypothetical protein